MVRQPRYEVANGCLHGHMCYSHHNDRRNTMIEITAEVTATVIETPATKQPNRDWGKSEATKFSWYGCEKADLALEALRVVIKLSICSVKRCCCASARRTSAANPSTELPHELFAEGSRP
mmetsp:Transcript_7598/g.14316  ORF Transcript_7598/g.14316 Transcript_7598/m.14316 type:complete len:120 (-) Transcript_7598:1330-1689(-)